MHYLGAQGMELDRGFRGSSFVMLQRLQRFSLSGYQMSSMPDKPSAVMTDGRLRIDAWLQDQRLHSRVVRVDGLPQDLPSWVRTVTNTTAAAFDRYLALLNHMGYACEWSRTLDGKRYVSLTGQGQRLYAALYPAQGLTRWLDDPVSDPLTDFRTPGGEHEFLLCQYGLHHSLMVGQHHIGLRHALLSPAEGRFAVRH